MPLPGHKISELITGVYEGAISVFELPEWLYNYTVYELDDSFFNGYGEIPRGDIKLTEKAMNFRSNIGHFSGAKTFDEVKTLSELVFDENGKRTPFAQFKQAALSIDNNYNVNWLKTEQSTVILQSQNARKWVKFEAEAEIFPYLEYVTIGDGRVRDSHARLDGLIRRVDDPIWNTIMPQNAFGCRCTVIQHEQARVTAPDRVQSKTAELMKDFEKNSQFRYNPGKTEYIFKETGSGKAGYFKQPREFSEELKNNFSFPSVQESTGIFL